MLKYSKACRHFAVCFTKPDIKHLHTQSLHPGERQNTQREREKEKEKKENTKSARIMHHTSPQSMWTVKPCLFILFSSFNPPFHSIPIQNIHFLQYILFPSNSHFLYLNLFISRHRSRSVAVYPFTAAHHRHSAQLLPLQFVEGLDPPKSSRQSPVLFGIVRRSPCGRVGGGGIGDGRCHHKYYVFPGGES